MVQETLLAYSLTIPSWTFTAVIYNCNLVWRKFYDSLLPSVVIGENFDQGNYEMKWGKFWANSQIEDDNWGEFDKVWRYFYKCKKYNWFL